MPDIQFENRIFLFADILGFRNLIRSDRRDEITNILYANNDGNAWLRIREQEERGTRFECNAFSDSLIASDIAAPESLFKVIEYALYIQNKFLWRGIFMRGGLVIDEIHHSQSVVVGEAIIRAAELEKQAHYPRILVSKEVVDRHFALCDEMESKYLRNREKFKIVTDQMGDQIINPFYCDPDERPFVNGAGRRGDLTLAPLLNIIKREIRQPRNKGFEERLEYVLALADLLKGDSHFDGEIHATLDMTRDGPISRYYEIHNMAQMMDEA